MIKLTIIRIVPLWYLTIINLFLSEHVYYWKNSNLVETLKNNEWNVFNNFKIVPKYENKRNKQYDLLINLLTNISSKTKFFLFFEILFYFQKEILNDQNDLSHYFKLV